MEDSQNSFGCNIAHCMDSISSLLQRENLEIINKEKKGIIKIKFSMSKNICVMIRTLMIVVISTVRIPKDD